MTDPDHALPPARLLWIGGDGRSGPEHAVRLLPPLLEAVQDVELIIAGSETDRSVARLLATDLRIADRVATPDPAVRLEQLLQSTALHVVTGDPRHSRSAIDLAASHGVPTIVCSARPDEVAQASRGAPGFYITSARKIAQLLRDEALRGRLGEDARTTEVLSFAVEADQTRTMPSDPVGSSPGASEAGIPPPAVRRGTGGRRAVKRQARKAGAAARHVLAGADPRGVPDRIVRLGAYVFDREPRTPLTPIRTLDFSTLGLGDTLMAWAGLHALLQGGYRPLAPGCTMHVQGALVRTGSALFARHGLRVVAAAPNETVGMASPILSPQPPRNWRELYRSIVGVDWRVNCFHAVDAQKPSLRADARYDPWERFCLGLTERFIHRRRGWQAAPAEYVGLRLWLPVARRMGLFPVTFLALFKQSLPQLRAELRAFVEGLGLAQGPTAAIAIFPTGKSYQAFPADFCRGLRDRLHPVPVVFYIPPDDPWIGAYRGAGLDLGCVDTVEELLWALLATPKVATTDSFASHAAQLLRDDFLLVLTRDVRENVLHPGANPSILANHPRCAPCHYVPRIDLTSCPARYDRCIAFQNGAFLDRIARVLLGGPA